MNALEFLDAAIRLSASPREADKRSAVSRAYYGVFHLAITFVKQAGIALPASAAVHEKLAWLLHAGNHTDATEAAGILESLRKARNRADYDLDATIFHDPATARMQLTRAQEIVLLLAACEIEPTRSQIRAEMRAYAKNTLRLLVTDDARGEA